MNNCIALLFFLILTVNCQSQSCEKFLAKKLDSSANKFVKKLKTQISCGSLDKFDLEYCSPFWGELYATRNDSDTYEDFYKAYTEFKQERTYLKYRTEMLPLFTFQQLKVTEENWLKVNKFLLESGTNKAIIQKYKVYQSTFSAENYHGFIFNRFKEEVLKKTNNQ